MSTPSPTIPPGPTLSPSSQTSDQILYSQLVAENQRIEEYIRLLTSQKTTDTQRYQYQSSSTDTLTTVYNVLFIVYLILVLVLCYILFMKNKVYSRTVKIVIVIFTLIFPFVIYPLETFVWTIGHYLYTLIVQTPYGTNPVETYKKDRGDIYVTATH